MIFLNTGVLTTDYTTLLRMAGAKRIALFQEPGQTE